MTVTVPTVYGNPANKPTVHVVTIGDLDVGRHVKNDGSIKCPPFGIKVAEDARNLVSTFETAFAKVGKADPLKSYLILNVGDGSVIQRQNYEPRTQATVFSNPSLAPYGSSHLRDAESGCTTHFSCQRCQARPG